MAYVKAGRHINEDIDHPRYILLRVLFLHSGFAHIERVGARDHNPPIRHIVQPHVRIQRFHLFGFDQ